MLAHAWISVPSTEKCSSDSRPSMRASSRMAPKNLLAISPPNSRSRFLVKHRHVPHRIVDAETDEPAEQQTVVQLLHQLPLRADGVKRLQQQRPQQLLRRDRRPADRRINRLEIAVQPGERCINHRPDRPQRMGAPHPRLQIDIAEQAARPNLATAHRYLLTSQSYRITP